MKKINPILLLAGGAVLAHFTTKGNGIFGIGAVKEQDLKDKISIINNHLNKEELELSMQYGGYGIHSRVNAWGTGHSSKKELNMYLIGMQKGIDLILRDK